MFENPSETLVAAVQFNPKILDVDSNIKCAIGCSVSAAQAGAKLIVLPELCFSGNVLRNADEAFESSQGRYGYQTQELSVVAQRYNCYIAAGYVEHDEDTLYNSCVLIGPNGYMANVRKHNLSGSDNLWATASEQEPFPVIVTPFAGVGALICRDVMNKYRSTAPADRPDYKFYTENAVDHMCLVTNWAQNYSYPDSSWIELREELGCNVIVSNRYGKERDMRFKGGTCIVLKDGTVLADESHYFKDHTTIRKVM